MGVNEQPLLYHQFERETMARRTMPVPRKQTWLFKIRTLPSRNTHAHQSMEVAELLFDGSATPMCGKFPTCEGCRLLIVTNSRCKFVTKYRFSDLAVRRRSHSVLSSASSSFSCEPFKADSGQETPKRRRGRRIPNPIKTTSSHS